MGKRLSNLEYIKIRKNIIKKLYANQAFKQGHLLIERLKSGIPSHLHGFTEGVLNELIKEGIVLLYGRTKYGKAYQLNIKKIKEIEQEIF